MSSPTESQKVTKRGLILSVLKNGGEFTAAEITHALGYDENFIGAASAYCRDLRKPAHGGYNIVGARRDHGYTYRLETTA